MMIPKDYTKQENIIANCLTEFGLRYSEQYEFSPYTVDFFVSELKMVIEADGKYGHLQKRDKKRDEFLLDKKEILYIVHVKDFTKTSIKETLWLELNKLE